MSSSKLRVFMVAFGSLIGCGGNVGLDPSSDGLGAATGGTNGVGTTATGGTYDTYPGGMVSLTPNEAMQIATDACAGTDGFLAGCSLSMPVPPAGRALDLTKISVIYNVNGGSTDQMLIRQTSNNCPNGNGWYLDTDTAGLQKITLCPQSCTTVKFDMTPLMTVRVQCAICGACIS
jgi:hypothetical protein